MNLRRRNFLKLGGLTAATLGLNAYAPGFIHRLALAGGLASQKRLIYLYQRGGSDGINAVIPRGDSDYNATTRPTLFIDEADALDLGNGFAQLHPMMGSLMDIYNSTALTGTAGPGNLAVVHRVGYYRQTQSHFDGQDNMDTGTTGGNQSRTGMLYNLLDELGLSADSFRGASISSGQILALDGPKPVPAISDPARFTFSGPTARVNKLIGQLPSSPEGTNGKGLLGFFGGPRGSGPVENTSRLYDTGITLINAVGVVQQALAQGPYIPANGAVYPSGTYGDRLKTIAMLLKRTDVQVLGLNIGGWDTHTTQGAIYGYHGNLLKTLADGIQALYRDLSGGTLWDDTVIVTMTEFGRTSLENGSKGTDHAQSSVSFVAGGKVKGGVYNCNPATWPAGSLFSEDGRYLRLRTDYRQVFREIFASHFGLDTTQLNRVIPGITQAASQRPSDFAPLNLMLA